MALRLLLVSRMKRRFLCSWLGFAVVLAAGCAHHWVGRPPTLAEIGEINRAAKNDDGSSVMALVPVVPVATAIDAFQPARPIVDTSTPEIRQVVSANATKLIVVDNKGATQTVNLSLFDGVRTTNRSRAIHRSGAAGALAGLGISGLLALSLLELQGAPDQPYQATPPSAPVASAVAIAFAGTLLGTALGLVIGYQNPDETFQFGEAR